jgi:membrane associated rhomboid family serine protease
MPAVLSFLHMAMNQLFFFFFGTPLETGFSQSALVF